MQIVTDCRCAECQQFMTEVIACSDLNCDGYHNPISVGFREWHGLRASLPSSLPCPSSNEVGVLLSRSMEGLDNLGVDLASVHINIWPNHQGRPVIDGSYSRP